MKRSFKLALLQMRIEPGNTTRNLARAGELISNAATKGAKCILLPEAMNLGWTNPSAKTGAEPIPEGETCQRLAACARSSGVYICSGIVEKSDHNIFNSAVLIDPKGEVILYVDIMPKKRPARGCGWMDYRKKKSELKTE